MHAKIILEFVRTLYYKLSSRSWMDGVIVYAQIIPSIRTGDLSIHIYEIYIYRAAQALPQYMY